MHAIDIRSSYVLRIFYSLTLNDADFQEGLMKVLHLGYHYIRGGKAPGPTCTSLRLRAQIQSLKDQGFEFFTCGQLARQLSMGRPLPEKHVTLSFDDGFRDHFTTAFPILREFGVPATFFVISCVLDWKLPPVIGFQFLIEKLGDDRLRYDILPGLFKEYGLWSYQRLFEASKFDYSGMKMGEPPELRLIKAVFNHFLPPSLQAEFISKIFRRYELGDEKDIVRGWFMDEAELLAMSSYGMEIASHSYTHPWFSMIGEDEIEVQIRRSLDCIHRATGRVTNTHGWVFGNATPRQEAQDAVRRAGCTSGWNFWSGWTVEQLQNKDIYQNHMDIPRLHEHAFNP